MMTAAMKLKGACSLDKKLWQTQTASHGQKSLVGYRPWDLEESDMTEQLNMNPGGACGKW